MRKTTRSLIATAAITVVTACSSKPTPAPAPVPPPVVAATPTWLSCPDPTDGPSILANSIDEAHRAWTANPSTPLPPTCVFSSLARVAGSVTDSTNDRALALAAEVQRRGPAQRELLAAEVTLFARARRFADVSRTYDRLVTLDPQPAMEVSRLAIAAARQRGDTASLLRLLSKTMARPDASPALRTEYNVVRQSKELWAAINEARGLLRQNPKYVAAYPSLVGNFGTLGLSDSVVAATRRAFAAGASRAAVLPAVETLVNAMLRHASVYGSTYGWDGAVASATRVDSALSTPSTKFLVAAIIVYAAESRTAEISSLIGTPALASASDAGSAQRRAAGCRLIPAVTASLDVAERRLREGGDRYPGGAGQVHAGLGAAREKVTSLQAICTRAGM